MRAVRSALRLLGLVIILAGIGLGLRWYAGEGSVPNWQGYVGVAAAIFGGALIAEVNTNEEKSNRVE